MVGSMVLASAAYAEDMSLDKRVEELEFASYSNTVKWTGFLENRSDSVT